MADRIIIKGEEGRARALRAVLALDGSKEWEVEVKRYRKRRSLSQNAYLHMILGIIADEIGDDIESVKEHYRDMYLPKVPSPLDESRLIGVSTTKLTTAEMNDFISKVFAHATSELGLRLPVPEEAHMRAA